MYVDITSKNALLEKEKDIAQLFLDSFGKPLSADEWRYFWIDNPVGNPYVSLCYENEKLLGHFAVVPTLFSFRGEPFVAYRAMTTMVHPDGRGKGLFTELSKRVNAMLQAAGASMIYGFPNRNAAPGYIRYLGWTLLSPDKACDFDGEEILESQLIQDALLESADIEWNTTDSVQADWRYSMPGVRIEKNLGLVLKDYQGVMNILHVTREGLNSIKGGCKYRALIPSGCFDKLANKSSIFDYQFGFRIFNEKYKDANFRREFVMSDVF